MSTEHLQDLEHYLALQRASASDPEVAHGAQDDAFVSALRAIAEGVENPQEVARRALTSCDVQHDRWYA